MLVSYHWLKEFVDFDLSPQELAELLTRIGLEVEEISDEAVLSIKVTSNRGDCLSILGISREIAAALDKPLKMPQIILKEGGKSILELASVEIENPELCPRYSARLIRGVEVKDSPLWLKEKLQACGLRPLNNIVDVTNFVMLELGQPLHAFDYDTLRGRKIIVRTAKQGEEIVTLDEKQRYLTSEDLIIADLERPVAVAGVMGGLFTSVTESTKNVLLESANFSWVSIRKTAQRLGLTTDSSYRFERGVDINGTVRALDRAAQMICELAGGEVAQGVLDSYPQPVQRLKITLRPERANKVLGTSLSKDQMVEILRALQLEVQADEKINVFVPTFRRDLKEEIDLIEEIARMYGYDKIQPTLPRGRTSYGKDLSINAIEDKIRQILVAHGLCEVVTFSLISPRVLEALDVPDKEKQVVKIKNPVSSEYSILRPRLYPSLLEVLARNVRVGIEDVHIFELGRVYIPRGAKELPEEGRWLAVMIMGSPWRGAWNLNSQLKELDFFYLKGILENLFAELGIGSYSLERYKGKPFHPGRCAEIYINSDSIGLLGELHPDIRQLYDLPKRVYLLELDLDTMLKHINLKRQFVSLPKYPRISRDLALVVSEEREAKEIEETIEAAAGELLESLELFDLYKGKPVPNGHKSLAYSLSFRAEDRTLTSEEIEKIMVKIKESLKDKLGASIRE